jgi:hypothetical protein
MDPILIQIKYIPLSKLNRDPNQIQIEKDKGTETMRRMKKETLNQ